ncbi:MAG: LysR family transcriptional regulator [Motiliproteus sp.]
MSIRHLKTLIAIADKGSFIQAADAVFITQAAVSMQMKTLEAELGAPLFDRTHRPPTLNEAGLALIPKARKIVRSYEQFMESPSVVDKLSGHLSVGSVPTMLTGVLPSALVNLRSSLPKLHIKVSSGLSGPLITQVERGSIDVAIISEPPLERPGIVWQPFGTEPLIVIAPLDSANLPPEELLRTQPFIRYSRNAWVGQMIEDYLKAEDIEVNEIMELNSLEAVATMVYHGLGVAIIPHRKIAYPGNLPVKQIPFTKDVPLRTLGIIEREDSRKSHLTKELLGELERAAKD